MSAAKPSSYTLSNGVIISERYQGSFNLTKAPLESQGQCVTVSPAILDYRGLTGSSHVVKATCSVHASGCLRPDQLRAISDCLIVAAHLVEQSDEEVQRRFERLQADERKGPAQPTALQAVLLQHGTAKPTKKRPKQ